MDIVLNWAGPFGFSRQHRPQFSPPTASGVYLWTPANETRFLRVSHVSQAANLADRFCEQVFWTLGGAYCLYTNDHLLRGNTPTPEYHPSKANLLTDFLEEDSRGSVLARRNLFAYRF